MSELQKIRIRLKAYDHALLDKSAAKIVEAAKKQERRYLDQFHYRLRKKL